MEKLYDRIDFFDNDAPALSAANLNAISKAIDDIDNRIIRTTGYVSETIPQIKQMTDNAQELIEETQQSRNDALEYKDEAHADMLLAKQYRDEAETFTPTGYAELVSDVATNKANIATNTADIAENTADITSLKMLLQTQTYWIIVGGL